MATFPAAAQRKTGTRSAEGGPRDRKSDRRGAAVAEDVPVVAARPGDRRAASGCLWDACEALLSAPADPQAHPRALDSLLLAFDCEGVSLHAFGPSGQLEPWCARGDWANVPGELRECMGVPLFRGRERVGALDLRARRGQRWTPDQLALVRTASGALGAALGARQELDMLRRQPGRDAITGLADARAWQHRLVDEIGRSERTGQPLGIALLDLDHFEGVNARYGAASGDAVLAECALVLKLTLRDGDFLARMSGDQFAVVLADCDLAPARRLAERLRHAIEEHRFPRAGKLSVSAGVAAAPRDGLDATELLAAAEQALALAKKSGRRRTAANGPAHAH